MFLRWCFFFFSSLDSHTALVCRLRTDRLIIIQQLRVRTKKKQQQTQLLLKFIPRNYCKSHSLRSFVTRLDSFEMWSLCKGITIFVVAVIHCDSFALSISILVNCSSSCDTRAHTPKIRDTNDYIFSSLGFFCPFVFPATELKVCTLCFFLCFFCYTQYACIAMAFECSKIRYTRLVNEFQKFMSFCVSV